MEEIRSCVKGCGYTMGLECLKCGGKTALAKPPKFSLDDKYAGLRREVRRKEFVARGLY